MPTQGTISLEPIRSALKEADTLDAPASEMGFVWSPGERLLVFATSRDFLEDALARPNVSSILLDDTVTFDRHLTPHGAKIIRAANAKLNFYRLHNSLRSTINFPPSKIHESAKIHPTAFVSDVGVSIGRNCVIESHVSIEAGVTLHDNVIIRSGCRIGSDAMDIKKDEDGNPYMTDHLGQVEIEHDVEIGSNSVVDRAIFRQTRTRIGAYTKMGCLVNISHGVQIGMRNWCASGVQICGSTSVGDDNWFGPGVIVSNLCSVGSQNYVSLGSHVLSDLADGWKVVGQKIFKERKLF